MRILGLVLSAVLLLSVAGNAAEQCTPCKGMGKIRCKVCNKDQGKDSGGIKMCPLCKGAGTTRDAFGNAVICQNCNGAKAFRCGDCTGGWKLCPACNGSGLHVVTETPKVDPEPTVQPPVVPTIKDPTQADIDSLKATYSRLKADLERLEKEIANLEARVRANSDKKVMKIEVVK